MANVLFLSYGDSHYDGRMRELIKIAQGLGTVYSVTRNKDEKTERDYVLKSKSVFSYVEFIFASLKMARKISQVDIIFIDNRLGCMPGILLKKIHKKAYFIQDVRELYIIEEQTTVRAKAGCLIEQIMIKQADAIVCANRYRANIMMENFDLCTTPLVYENLRKLTYKSELQKEECEIKYRVLRELDKKIVISTSGWRIDRTNDVLLDAVANKEDLFLLLVGTGPDKDRKIIEQKILDQAIKNVMIIDTVTEGELKYLLSISTIGVVNYGDYDTNNRYCASGKIYEFLFEEIPVVTTENLPLKELCNQYKIGRADNHYIDAINEIIENYEEYISNIKIFLEQNDVMNNNEHLIQELKKMMIKEET